MNVDATRVLLCLSEGETRGFLSRGAYRQERTVLEETRPRRRA